MTHPSAAPPSSARARAMLALVITGSALVVIDITVVVIGLPQIQADLGGSLASIQWVIVAYTVTMGAVTQVVGTLSDRLGRRRIYLAGICLFTAASAACGLAPTVVLLDLARVLQGIGGAILMSNALPILSDAYEGQRRNMAIAKWGTAAAAAGVAAPLLGGVLVDLLSWRAVFLVNVPFGVAALVVGLAVLPADSRAQGKRGSIDWTGTILLIASLVLGNFALIRGEEQGWGSAQTLIQFGLAAVLLAAFLAVEVRVPAPTLDPGLFRKPAFTGTAFAVFMSRVLTIGGTVYFVQYFHNALHLTPTQSGLLLAPAIIAQVGAGLLGGRLLGKFPAGSVIAAGYACKAIGGAWLGLAFTPEIQPWLLAFPLLVWGTGGGIAGVPVMAVAMNVTDRQRSGMVAGTITSLASIGAGVGTAVLGVLYKARVAAVVSGHPDIPADSRASIAAAAAEGDTARALDLAPPQARESVQRILEEAVAAAGSAVLLTSAALAAVTIAAVLVLISRRNVSTAQHEDAAREKDETGNGTAADNAIEPDAASAPEAEADGAAPEGRSDP